MFVGVITKFPYKTFLFLYKLLLFKQTKKNVKFWSKWLVSAVLREAHLLKSTSRDIKQGGSAESLRAALLLGFGSGFCFALVSPFFSMLSITSHNKWLWSWEHKRDPTLLLKEPSIRVGRRGVPSE